VLALALWLQGGVAAQTTPDITVSTPGNPNIVSGQKTPIDFGKTTLATRKEIVFTLTNTGTTTISLIDQTTHGYPSIRLPAGFTLSNNLDKTSLAPKESTTFTLALNSATTGTPSGLVVFTTNVPGKDPFTIPVQGVVTPDPKNPQGGPLTDADAVRFLEQTTWGPNEALVASVKKQGLAAFLEAQLAQKPSVFPDLPLQLSNAPTGLQQNDPASFYTYYTLDPLQNYFFTNGLYGDNQLRQRVAWALHQITVINGNTLGNRSFWTKPYVELLDRSAFGNYRTFIGDMTLNPGMGRFLNMQGSTRTSPNENYGRELMQLFTIGLNELNPDGTPVKVKDQLVPTYDQNVVEANSHVQTGWNFAAAPKAGITNYRDPMVVVNNGANHDYTAQTLLRGYVKRNRTPPPGSTNAQKIQLVVDDLNDSLDNIVNHPNCGPFICTQLIQHLVTSNPSPAYVARVAAVFDNDAAVVFGKPGKGIRGNLTAVLRAILLDPEARGSAQNGAFYGHLRSPAQFTLGILRAFNAKSKNFATNGGLPSDGYLRPQTDLLDQIIFNPPSVFSYYPPDFLLPGSTTLLGPEFKLLSTTTAIKRSNFVYQMTLGGGINPLANLQKTNPNPPPATIDSGFSRSPNGTALDLTDWVTANTLANVTNLVDRLNTLLLHGTMDDTVRANLITTLQGISNNTTRTQTAIYLVATSASYQVER
jgi:uncharacterized protein (DUF1800 family)